MSEHNFTGTGEPLNTIATNKQAIIDFLHIQTAFSIETGVPESKITAHGPNANKVSYPIVVILSGAGNNGKTTFINAVGKVCSTHHISVIDPVKRIADAFITVDEDADKTYPWMPINAAENREGKTDRYRQFLYALKMTWVGYDDGPTHYAMGELFKVINDQLTAGGECHDIVFIECREPDEIRKLSAKVQEAGLIPLTVIISGLTDPASFQNGSDSQVEGYNYDLNIKNNYGGEEMFILQATMFAKMLAMANNVYGVKINDDAETDPAYTAATINGSEIATGTMPDVSVTTSERIADKVDDGPDAVVTADPMAPAVASTTTNTTVTGEGAGYPENHFPDDVSNHPAS